MQVDYLTGSLESLLQSTALIKSLPFRQTNSLSKVALASVDEFDEKFIRDVHDHERALFSATKQTSSVTGPAGINAATALNQAEDGKWIATKRAGPKMVGVREKASPLKERRTANVDPRRALLAATKLLDLYPLPRATEHVEALFAQYDGLSETIAELEETLKRPLSRPQPHPGRSEDASVDAEREEEIRREEMEIFALEQINFDKQTEVDSLIAQAQPAQQPKPKPKTRQPLGPKPKQTVPPPSSLSLSPPPKPPSRTPIVSHTRVPSKPTSLPSPPSEKTSPRTPRHSAASTTSSGASTPKALSPKKVSDVTPRASTSQLAQMTLPTPANTSKVDKRPLPPKTKAAPSVPKEDLELVAEKVWENYGDVLRPWGRKTLQNDGSDILSPLRQLPFSETMKTLSTLLSTTASPFEPLASPSSSLATMTSEQEDFSPLPPSPATVIECQVLNLFLSTLSGLTPIPDAKESSSSSSEEPLSIIFRDPTTTSRLSTAGGPQGSKEPMVSMNLLKARLGSFAKRRGWAEDMATTGIYSLVSKAILRIDRRGAEGPALGLRN